MAAACVVRGSLAQGVAGSGGRWLRGSLAQGVVGSGGRWPLTFWLASVFKSVFLILTVRPKSLHASDNLSTLRCMSASDPAFRAQSSAYRTSLMRFVMALVFA